MVGLAGDGGCGGGDDGGHVLTGEVGDWLGWIWWLWWWR